MEKANQNSRAKIIIVTGPESTAKSTIVQGLAERFNGEYTSEYAREYIKRIGKFYTYEDIERIAFWQKEALDRCLKSITGQVFFVDTYLIITKVWFKWFSGNYPSWLDEEINKTNEYLYLLCAPDIAWVPDDVREHGGDDRIELFHQYKDELDSCKLNYRIVTGKGDERMKNACTFVAQYIE